MPTWVLLVLHLFARNSVVKGNNFAGNREAITNRLAGGDL